MKVLVIIGSKKNGNTDKITRQFINGAISAGHEVDVEYLFTKKNVHGCIDCQTCKRNGGICVWKDDITPMLDKVLKADVLVFASPVYFFSISSQLKLFMDRTYAVIEKIRDKKFYFIATAEGPSDTFSEDLNRVVEPIQGYLDCFQGMQFVKTICCFDMGKVTDITETDAYKDALEVGTSI